MSLLSPKWIGSILAGIALFGANSVAKAQQIKSFLVHVHTTEDDKDKPIQFTFWIMKGNFFYGKEVTGHRQLWPNGDKRDIRINLENPIPFGSRMEYRIRHDYANNEGNHGWEGRIKVDAEFVGGGSAQVLGDTGNYKLGENRNPKTREFQFNK